MFFCCRSEFSQPESYFLFLLSFARVLCYGDGCLYGQPVWPIDILKLFVLPKVKYAVLVFNIWAHLMICNWQNCFTVVIVDSSRLETSVGVPTDVQPCGRPTRWVTLCLFCYFCFSLVWLGLSRKEDVTPFLLVLQYVCSLWINMTRGLTYNKRIP